MTLPSRPIRVLNHLPFSSRNWGGVQVQFENFLAATAGDPRIENFLTIDGRELPSSFGRIAADLSAPPFDHRKWAGMLLPNGMRPLAEAFRARRWGIDVVVNLNLIGDRRTVRVAERMKAAAVYWERGAAWFAREKPLPSSFRTGHALIVANSVASRRMLRDRWRIEGDIELLTPCVWDTQLGRLAAGRALPGDRPLRLGFAARLRGFKGGVLAVHALSELGRRGVDAVLLVAGDGPDRPSMEAAAASLAVADKVRFLGHVREMNGFYAEIDLLLHPALREPYGNVCAEAAFAGVPVVATCVDGLPEVVEHGVTGLCVKPELSLDEFAGLGGNRDDVYRLVYRADRDELGEPSAPGPAALAQAVLAIAGEAGIYAAFSARAAARAKERFAPAAHIDRFIALMRTAAERR